MDSLHQFLYASHDRALVDAKGSIFRFGLHDQGERDFLGMVKLALIASSKVGSADVVKLKKLFGQAFVLRQIKALRPRARVGTAEQIKERRNVHLHGVVAGVGFNEVEKQVCLL